jgi:hypothetical protein
MKEEDRNNHYKIDNKIEETKIPLMENFNFEEDSYSLQD